MTKSTQARAEAAIANLGERATEARRRTLEALLSVERPLSQTEIETKLATHGALDRDMKWTGDVQARFKIWGNDIERRAAD